MFITIIKTNHGSDKINPSLKEIIFALQTIGYAIMEKRKLDKATSDKISFMAHIVPAFAGAYKMNVQDAFFYLKKYGGWDYLNEHWWALHTDNPFWAVRSMYEICHKNGGMR